MKKRIVSIITSLALCLSLLPAVSVPAVAEATPTVDRVTITGGTVESIYGGGYSGGVGSTEDPKGTATRAHVAQMIQNFMENADP